MEQPVIPRSSFLTFIVVILIGLAGRVPAAARFPFPRHQAYPFGIVSSLATPGGAEVQKNFQAWRDSSSGYYRGYVEHGDYAYIDAGLLYHSSELAYGMLVMVMMDNATNNTQPKFDKLLATYDLRLDSNGLMSWRTRVNAPKPDSVVGYFAATDADLDAALALLLAHKQWGDDRYLTRAKALITNIWDHERDSTGNLLQPGDDWDKYKNPSYLNFAAFRLFEQVDKSHDWLRIEEASWKLLQANTTPPNSTSRLPTDWCVPDGKPVRGNRSGIDFNYDAIRVPFRAGLAYSWFGDSRGQVVDSNIAAFALSPAYDIQGHPDSIRSGYAPSGVNTWYGKSAHPFLLAFADAGMVDRRFQAWVDTGYARLSNWGMYESYIASLTMLSLLYMSGNFNNFWDSTAFPVTAGVAPSPNPNHPGLGIESSPRKVRLRWHGSSPLDASLWDTRGTRQNLPIRRDAESLILETASLPHGIYLLRWSAGDQGGSATVPR
jgi:endo-1,4-beta-D-glucanase Y